MPDNLQVSHPTRVRGLKENEVKISAKAIASHPTRVRGLKDRQPSSGVIIVLVAPHAGAWIESARRSNSS